jgi:hypothetical protein
MSVESKKRRRLFRKAKRLAKEILRVRLIYTAENGGDINAVIVPQPARMVERFKRTGRWE